MDDHIRVLSWAERHLEAFEATLRRFWEEQPTPLRTKGNIKTREQVVSYIPRRIPLDPEWAFRIGDVVHNMRVSLDYLAFHVVTKYAKPKKLTQVSFPICDKTAEDYREMAGRRIAAKQLPKAVKDAFEGLQPYHRGKTKDFHPLASLDRLENVHKHRRLLSARPAVTAVVQDGVSDKIKITRFYNPNGAVLDKPTELYGYVVLDRSHVAADVQFRVREHICFHESPDVVPTQGIIVVRLLKQIRDFIRDEVFREFESFV